MVRQVEKRRHTAVRLRRRMLPVGHFFADAPEFIREVVRTVGILVDVAQALQFVEVHLRLRDC